MALEWLEEMERAIARACAEMRNFCAHAPPDEWEPESVDGEYLGCPGWMDDPDVSNSGDVHYHGVLVGRQRGATVMRQALRNLEGAPRLCRAVRELYVALREMLDAYSDMARLEEWAEDAPEPPPALERAHDRWIEARRQAKRVLERWGRGGE